MKINELELERYLVKYEFISPYLFCVSDSEPFTMNEFKDMDKNYMERFNKLKLGYVNPQGSEYLREEISKLYLDTESEDVIVFSGAAEAIFVFMNVLLDKGDHVIVQWPCYQPLYEIPASIGCEVTKWEMDEGNGWMPDIDFLISNVKENTKMIVINNPHNPTGFVFSEKAILKIVDTAKQKGIWIFSDEVYRFSEYEETYRKDAIVDIYEKGISVGAMSKIFGLGGLRIGWGCVKNKNILNKVVSFKDYTTICCSAPSEMLSALALKNKDKIIERNIGIIKENLALLDDFFERYSEYFEWVRPKGGAIGFPKIKFDSNAREFSKDILDKKGVMILPGYVFGSYDKNFRIGFGRYDTKEVLSKFEEYVVENIKN